MNIKIEPSAEESEQVLKQVAGDVMINAFKNIEEGSSDGNIDEKSLKKRMSMLSVVSTKKRKRNNVADEANKPLFICEKV